MCPVTVPQLLVEDVSFGYTRGTVLFERLSLALGLGSLTAVVGPSGSGKSTLLHLMAGWALPSSGEVRRPGIASTQWVFQNPVGTAQRTALDHVALPRLTRGATRQEAEAVALQILDRFALGQVAGRPFKTLSGGEAQRLMLARAFAAQPDLLLVDEPTAQLDSRSAGQVIDVLASVASSATIVVVATHDSRLAASCEDTLDLGAFAPGLSA